MAVPVAVLARQLAKKAAKKAVQRRGEPRKKKNRWSLIILGLLIAGLLIFGPMMMLLSMMGSTSGGAAAGALAARDDCFSSAGDQSGVTTAFTGGGAAKSGAASEVQKAHAKDILGVAKGLGLSRQAAVVALMVSYQESQLGTIPGYDKANGDGDLGDFQQRGKLGWYAPGDTLAETHKLILDTRYAATVFFQGRTVDKSYPGGGNKGSHIPGLLDVKGWEGMPLTVAAQKVQRSAFGDAYAKWETAANKLYDELYDEAEKVEPLNPKASGSSNTGSSAAALSGADTSEGGFGGCGPESYGAAGECPVTPDLSTAVAGMKPDTTKTTACVHKQFPKIKTFYGVREDPIPDHPSGRAVDIMISSAFPDIHSADAVAYGDEIAKWAKAHQKELGIEYIIWNQKIWNIKRDKEGWRSMDSRGGDTQNHKDHVHITTYGNAAVAAKAGPGGATMMLGGGSGSYGPPMKPGSYTLGPSWGAMGSWARYHTGQDMAAPIGNPTYAVCDGVVGPGNGIWQAGTHVVLHCPGGDSVVYWHLSVASASQGQKVKAGQQIGAVGVTGRTFGPHLHFEYYPPGAAPTQIYTSKSPTAWLAAHGVKV